MINTDKLPAFRISLTSRCNLKCEYCPIHYKHDITCKSDLPEERFYLALDSALELGFKKIGISGGEPFLWKPNLGMVIDNLAKQHPSVEFYIYTNGTLLSSNIDAISGNNNIILKISLDTFNSIQYKKITNIKAFNQVKNSIIEARKRNIRVGINMVLTKNTINNVEYLISFCKEHGCYLKILELNNHKEFPPDFWNSQWISPKHLFPQLNNEFVVSDFVTAVGGYGILMHRSKTSKNFYLKIKDAAFGTAYSDVCRECEYYNNLCKEGVYQLILTVDQKLKICRHNPKLDISVKNITNINDFRTCIMEALNRYFFNSTRINYLQNDTAIPKCSIREP